MDVVRKILLFAVGLILCITFVAIGVSVFNRSKGSVNDATAKYDNLMSSLETDYAKYKANDVIKGSELRQLIMSSGVDDVRITVKTIANTTGKTYSITSNNITSKKTDKDYIDPNADFEVTSPYSSGSITFEEATP